MLKQHQTAILLTLNLIEFYPLVSKGWITSKRSHCIAFECLLKKTCLRNEKWTVLEEK